MVNFSTPIIHSLAIVGINALNQGKDISRLEYRQSYGGYSQQPKWISHLMELTLFNDFDTHITEQTNKQTQLVSAFKVPKGETKVWAIATAT